MADEQPSLAEIMDTAIAEASGNAPDSNAPTSDTSADDSAANTDTAAEAEGEAGAAALEGDEAVEGTDADGEGADTDEGADGDEADGEGDTAEEKAATKAAELVKAEKAAIDAPIPKDVRQETADRIKTLIDIAKKATSERDETVQKVTAERDTAAQERDQLVSTIQATGMTPQQFGEHLQFERLARSKETAPKAIELLVRVLQDTAAYWGIDIPSLDPLAKHTDLQQAVQTGQMTAKYAKELALSRASTGLRANLDAQASTAAATRQAQEQELQSGRNGLNQIEATLRGSDPNYEAKRAILIKQLKEEFSKTPPSQWPAKWLAAYQTVKLPAAPKANRGQPMRAKQGAGGQKTEPKSMQDAVFGALSNMGV